MTDRAALEAEREQLVSEMAQMQKQFMADEFVPRHYFSSEEVKAFRAQYQEKARRLSKIANQLVFG